MTETIDDTKTGTIALSTPCPTPGVAVSLVSQDGLTVTADVQTSPGSGASWKSYNPSLSWDDGSPDMEPVTNGHHTHTYAAAGTYSIGVDGGNTCGKSSNAGVQVTVAPAVVPAKGVILGIDIPVSVKHGELVRIDLVVKNTGGLTAVFQLKYYFNGSLVITSDPWVMPAGHQKNAGGPIWKAPASGTSMTYKVELMRVG